MAVLICCFELELIDGNAVPDHMFKFDRSQIKERLADLWLDEGVMDASNRDDYLHIEAIVQEIEKAYFSGSGR